MSGLRFSATLCHCYCWENDWLTSLKVPVNLLSSVMLIKTLKKVVYQIMAVQVSEGHRQAKTFSSGNRRKTTEAGKKESLVNEKLDVDAEKNRKGTRKKSQEQLIRDGQK